MSEKKEMVNHPNHYGGDTEYECIKVLKAWNTPEEFVGFCKDNAIKYLCRSGKKDEVLQEYKKALRDCYIAYNIGITNFKKIGRYGRNQLRIGYYPVNMYGAKKGDTYEPIHRYNNIYNSWS